MVLRPPAVSISAISPTHHTSRVVCHTFFFSHVKAKKTLDRLVLPATVQFFMIRSSDRRLGSVLCRSFTTTAAHSETPGKDVPRPYAGWGCQARYLRMQHVQARGRVPCSLWLYTCDASHRRLCDSLFEVLVVLQIMGHRVSCTGLIGAGVCKVCMVSKH
jgi:hypothetical protein